MILLFDVTRVVGSPLNISRVSLRRTFIVRNQTRFPLDTQLDLIQSLIQEYWCDSLSSNLATRFAEVTLPLLR